MEINKISKMMSFFVLFRFVYFILARSHVSAGLRQNANSMKVFIAIPGAVVGGFVVPIIVVVCLSVVSITVVGGALEVGTAVVGKVVGRLVVSLIVVVSSIVVSTGVVGALVVGGGVVLCVVMGCVVACVVAAMGRSVTVIRYTVWLIYYKEITMYTLPGYSYMYYCYVLPVDVIFKWKYNFIVPLPMGFLEYDNVRGWAKKFIG